SRRAVRAPRGTLFPYTTLFRSTDATGPRVGVRIGDQVLDLAPVAEEFTPWLTRLFDAPSLNPLMAAGSSVWTQVRQLATEWLSRSEEHTSELQSRGHLVCRLQL